jgi:hypothetical protein
MGEDRSQAGRPLSILFFAAALQAALVEIDGDTATNHPDSMTARAWRLRLFKDFDAAVTEPYSTR